jgi:hypothetical protein
MKKNQFKIPKVLAPLAKALKDEADRRTKMFNADGSYKGVMSKEQAEKETVCDFASYLFMEDITIDRFMKILTNEKLYKKYI